MSKHSNHPPLEGMIISDTSIRQPVFVTMLMLLAVVIGLLAYSTRPVNLLPEIDVPIVTVRVAYPGAGPETVADQVARPIEDELATLSGVDTITSNSSEGFAVIIVEFTQDTNVAIALQDVREKVAAIRARLPQAIEEPVYERVDPNQDPILTLAISGDGARDSQELRQLLEDEIVPAIQRAPGVGSTTLIGGRERQINVHLDLARLQALRILPAQVHQAIAQASTDVGVGTTLAGEQEFSLRTPSVFDSPAAIATVGIGNTGYQVRDIARIEDGYADIENYTRLNGAETIILEIRRQSGTNTVAVADAALAEIEEVFANYPDLHYELIVNEAERVRAQVNGAIEEILLAVVFAMLVVWVFFRDIRNTLVTVLGLPVILICTFAGMALFDVTINVVSLLALSISAGLVIDDAIVVRENIFRHLERGEHPFVAASRGTAQVAPAVVAMTLTVIVVFLPAAFTGGTVGIIFGAFGLTVVSGMIISIIEAFTMAPATAAHWSRQRSPKPQHITPGEEHLPDEAHEELGRMERVYAYLLDWTLRHRMVMVGLTLLIVVASVYVAQSLKFSFFPYVERYQFGMEIELPPGTPLAETDRQAREVEARLLADPAVETVLTTVGDTGESRSGGGSERATFLVSITEEATTLETQERLRAALAGFPGLNFNIPQPGGANFSVDVTQRPIQILVRGVGDVTDLAPIAEQLIAAFDGIEGLTDVDMTYTPGSPELRYALRQQRANDYGLTNQDLSTTLRTLVDGSTAATYREEGEDYDIVVRLRPEDRRSIEDLGAVRLPLGPADVPINAIADIEVASSPTTIRRTDRQTEIVIGANNFRRNRTEIENEMRARMAAVELPQGVRVRFGGDAEEQQEGFRSLLLAMALSVTFVYMVLASQFGSFSQPLVIMLAMPLSFIGAFLSLTLTGLEMGIVPMIGMLMLMGLVVKNSILLVDFTNALRDAGMSMHAALVRAGAIRLRPVLMTALALILASVPSAIGLGEGAEIRRGLATVVVGGMLASTMLTLLLVPTAYSLMEGFTAWLGMLFRRADQAPEAGQVPTPGGSSATASSHQGRAEHADAPQAGTNGSCDRQATVGESDPQTRVDGDQVRGSRREGTR